MYFRKKSTEILTQERKSGQCVSILSVQCSIYFTSSLTEDLLEFFLHMTTAPTGPRPPHYRRFTITHRQTTPGGLLWTSDQPDSDVFHITTVFSTAVEGSQEREISNSSTFLCLLTLPLHYILKSENRTELLILKWKIVH